MERLPLSQLDIDSAGILVANFLQSWWRAGLALEAPTRSKESCHELQNPNPPSPEDGLCLPAPIDDGSSLSSPGEHQPPVCLEGPSPGVGLAIGADSSAGCRPGTVGHPGEQPLGFQDPGGRCFSGESGRRLRLGSFATVALVQRLASLAGDLLFNRNPDRRCRWLLRSGRFQRSALARAQRHHVASRTAFYPRAPRAANATRPNAESSVSRCRWATCMATNSAAFYSIPMPKFKVPCDWSSLCFGRPAVPMGSFGTSCNTISVFPGALTVAFGMERSSGASSLMDESCASWPIPPMLGPTSSAGIAELNPSQLRDRSMPECKGSR